MIGLLHHQGVDLEAFFSGEGYAPDPLTAEERDRLAALPPDSQPDWNLPLWLHAEFQRSLGEKADRTAALLQIRAPVSLRVNRSKTTREKAIDALHKLGIEAAPNPTATYAVTLGQGAQKLRQSDLYLDGQVELQDAASQAVVDVLPDARRCLDYCAGGGGKALALAALEGRDVYAHDAEPARMSDLPARAARAAAKIEKVETDDLQHHAPFDLVLCDAPCSGSGAWRRSPEGKWALTPDRLTELTVIQLEILTTTAGLVAPGGWLVYATCSVLKAENEDVIASFLALYPTWQCRFSKRFDVDENSDGFYTAHLTQV